MPVAMEIFGFFLTAVGLLMLGVTLAHSSWRVSTVHGNVITTNTIFENLWYSCATDSMGVHNCWEFPSMLALSGYIQACRALMITAILLGFLGLFLGMVGLRCTNIGGLELSRKTKLAATAGALHILAGLAGFSGSSPRYLRDGGRLLVRLQHHQGLLRPLVRRNQVRAGPCPLPGLERLPARHPGRHLPLL
ncbi:PREDICTED: claudin-15 isoform X3 [Capra hircus]|uniref:claudin-15 isoform X3 n=1 Tax=Capra hircus TaxID=9925 RepID=UPI000846BEF1|nr:PREDICTED: claudin-15 isoform X3 [Capra hircus]